MNGQRQAVLCIPPQLNFRCPSLPCCSRPLDPPKPLPPPTHLAPPLRELLEANPDVFAERQPTVARGVPREGNLSEISIGGAAPVSPVFAAKQMAVAVAAAAATDPPKHEQRQRGQLQQGEVEQVESPGHHGEQPSPLSAGAATKQSAVEIKPPPMKKAKLIRLRAGGSKVAAVETPAEEARKLADGFAAFAQQFVGRREMGPSVEQGEQEGEEDAKHMGKLEGILSV